MVIRKFLPCSTSTHLFAWCGFIPSGLCRRPWVRDISLLYGTLPRLRWIYVSFMYFEDYLETLLCLSCVHSPIDVYSDIDPHCICKWLCFIYWVTWFYYVCLCGHVLAFHVMYLQSILWRPCLISSYEKAWVCPPWGCYQQNWDFSTWVPPIKLCSLGSFLPFWALSIIVIHFSH